MSQTSIGPAPPNLEESLLTTWDAQVVDYDAARFPFSELIRDEVRRLGHPIERLDQLHTVVPLDQVYVLSKQLCDATNRPDFRHLVNDFARQEIVPKGRLVPPIAAQRFLNVRIMLPNKPQGVFPFHTGLLYGHGPGSRSLWLPLTDVSRPEDRSASLQIIGLKRSRELIRKAHANRMSVPEMTELFGSESFGVRAAPGQVLFFTQENIHGNFVNVTGKTRVSIDFRLAESRYGDQLARKILGGYFEVVPEPGKEPYRPDHIALKNGRTNVIYLNNNTPSTVHVPPHLQRCMVYEYCQKNDLKFEFELFELETMNHLPTLLHVVDELGCNAILYSIYSLPEAPAHRQRIYAAARAKGVYLYFVNENMALAKADDEARIEQFLEFAKYGEPADAKQV
jgi:sporadic carbohydrate cluster protein (TIGR04323 family)